MRKRGQNAPTASIWGNIQTVSKLANGVFEVSTASHGGIMVDMTYLSDYCTPAQVKFGSEVYEDWVCFEEDLAVAVFIDTNIGLFKGVDKEVLELTLQRYYPDYLIERNGSDLDSPTS